MSKEKRSVPKLRFPGFTEDWEQRKLSDITEIVMGQSPSSKNYTDNPNDNILVQGNADLKDGKVVPRLWTKEITKTIDKDGIILTVRAPVGDVARTDYKVVLGRGVAGIKGNDYIYQFLQKLQNNRYWVSLSSGSTFESINSNDIKDLIIDIPSIEEQTKISMLLNNVNSIITLHQRKLEHLNLKKKALLQKLFPKNGERYPELRFPGFTDAWEQRKLGDYLSIPEKEILEVASSDDLITVKLNLGGVELGASRDTLSLGSTVYYKRYAGQFIYGKQNFFNGSMGLIPTNLDGKGSSGDVPSFNVSNIEENYLYTYVSRESYWRSKEAAASGTGSKRIHEKTFLDFNIDVPSMEEQKLISNTFDLIDRFITLHQRKLEHLQLQKKALLQQMFV